MQLRTSWMPNMKDRSSAPDSVNATPFFPLYTFLLINEYTSAVRAVTLHDIRKLYCCFLDFSCVVMLKRRAAGAVNPLWLRPIALRLTLLHRGTGLHRISITHLHLSNRMLDQLIGHSFEVRGTRLGIRTAQQALPCALLRTTQQATWLVFVSQGIFVLYSLWQAAQRGESMTSCPCLRFFFFSFFFYLAESGTTQRRVPE